MFILECEYECARAQLQYSICRMFHFISEAIIKAQMLVLEGMDPSAEEIRK